MTRMQRAVAWTLAGGSALPLVVFHGFLNPFAFGRAMVLRAAAAALLPILLVLWRRHPESRPRASALVFLGGAYVLFVSAALFLGADPLRSLMGDLERSEGVLMAWTLVVVFLAAQTAFRLGYPWRTLWRVNLLVGSVVVLLALLHLSAANVLAPADAVVQPYGSLANPAFLGEYLLVLLVFALMLLAAERGRIRFVWASLAALFLVVLLLVQNRGVLLGVLLSAAAGLAFERRRLAAAVRAVTARRRARSLALAAAAVFALAASVPFLGSLGHLSQSFGEVDSSLLQRAAVWREALRAVAERPLAGWGSENFLVVFYGHPPSELWRYTAEVFDRAHDEPVEQAVAHGIAGLLLFLGLLLALRGSVRRAIAAAGEGERPAFRIAVYGLAAYGVSLLFLFETQSAAYVLALLLGLLVARDPGAADRPAFGTPARAAVAAAGALAVVFAFVGAVQPMRAAVAAAGANALFWKEPAAAYAAYREAFSMNTALNREIAKEYALNLISEGEQGVADADRWLKDADLAEAALRAETARHPWDPSPWNVLSRLFDLRSRVEPAYAFAGIAALEESLRRYPRNFDMQYRLALARIRVWDGRGGVATLQEAIRLAPENRNGLRYLAMAHALLGDRAASAEAFRRFVEASARLSWSSGEEGERERVRLQAEMARVPLMRSVPRL